MPENLGLQVEPPVKAADGGQGASLLWWAQEVAPADTLWSVAAAASAAVKRESEAKGGLAFWSRMYADKTMFEAMGQETPFYNPPFTVRTFPHLPLAPFCPTSSVDPLGCLYC